jgi:hypothetical protein
MLSFQYKFDLNRNKQNELNHLSNSGRENTSDSQSSGERNGTKPSEKFQRAFINEA